MTTNQNPPSSKDDDDSIWDVFKVLKHERQVQGRKRRSQAWEDFKPAAQAASQFGMVLIQHTETHYSLRHQRGWILNIYPGNRRLYRDPNTKVRSPYLQLPEEWNLIDVVEACARHEEKEQLKASEVVRGELQDGDK
jgi:hypothetical protein